jgi:hypothetical protein
VCRILHIFIFIYLRILLRCFFGSLPFFTIADKCISKKIQKKKTRKKTAQEQNTKGKHAECDHVKKTANQKSSEAESLNIRKILRTWRWPSRPKHVVKDSGNQHTIKLHADGDITCNTHSYCYFWQLSWEQQWPCRARRETVNRNERQAALGICTKWRKVYSYFGLHFFPFVSLQ